MGRSGADRIGDFDATPRGSAAAETARETYDLALSRDFEDCDREIRRALAGRTLQEADRDDCAQQVWLDVLSTRLSGYRGGRLTAWLAVVARNKGVDALRKRRRQPGMVLDDIPCPAEREICRADDARATVWPALAELERVVSPRGSLVFYLRWIEGWSFGEIGEVLGLSPSQARLQHHRVKQKFREIAGALFGAGRRGARA